MKWIYFDMLFGKCYGYFMRGSERACSFPNLFFRKLLYKRLYCAYIILDRDVLRNSGSLPVPESPLTDTV